MDVILFLLLVVTTRSVEAGDACPDSGHEVTICELFFREEVDKKLDAVDGAVVAIHLNHASHFRQRPRLGFHRRRTKCVRKAPNPPTIFDEARFRIISKLDVNFRRKGRLCEVHVSNRVGVVGAVDRRSAGAGLRLPGAGVVRGAKRDGGQAAEDHRELRGPPGAARGSSGESPAAEATCTKGGARAEVGARRRGVIIYAIVLTPPRPSRSPGRIPYLGARVYRHTRKFKDTPR